jgi:signal transduction histidine kinase
LFPNAPLILAALVEPETSVREAGSGVTGLVLDNYRATAELALRLHPATKRIAVVAQVADEGLTARYQDVVRRQLRDVAPRVDISFLGAPTLSRLILAVKSLPKDAVILYIDYFPEDPDRGLATPWAEPVVAQESPVPVYGTNQRHIGSGVVGGAIYSPRALGMSLGGMASTILAGTRAQDLPIARAPDVKTLDWRAMQRWGIDASRLPGGADVQFRPASAWEQFRWYILTTVSVTALQALLIVGLLVQRAKRRKAETLILTREAALRSSFEETRQLTGRLVTAQEEERARIARELHDDVGQRIASLSIGLSAVKRQIPESAGPVLGEVSAIQQETMKLSKDLRQLSHELHPGVLEHLGLVEALRVRCDEIRLESGIVARVRVGDEWANVPDDIALCLYRVAQEALRNIVKHAHATCAEISLARRNGDIVMSITDDGRGLDASSALANTGLGLVSMRERVRTLGGRFDLEASAQSGTVATVTLPAGDGA